MSIRFSEFVFVILCYVSCTVTGADNFNYQQLINDIKIHEGYSIKYSFKDNHYQDIDIIPNQNLSNWYSITLNKDISGDNIASLQTYNGHDFEEISNPDSRINVGSCRQIRKFLRDKEVFLIATRCGVYSNSSQVYLIDLAEKEAFRKIQDLPFTTVRDAQFWNNIRTNELNLIILTSEKPGSKLPAALHHYVFDSGSNQFLEVDKINQHFSLSVTAFNINDETFIAVTNYKDALGNFVYPVLYVQEITTGKLVKYQNLRTKYAVSFTYFCYIGDSKTEHFLLAANNKKYRGYYDGKKDDATSFAVEESLLFKWDHETASFLPFQTLLASFPTPWIIIPSNVNKILLLTWSYIDGIISYQYDGWRFIRTAISQSDIINDPPTLAYLKPLSISGDTLFTIFSKGGAKKKYLFAPTFRDNEKARLDMTERDNWCRNAFVELRLATTEFDPHFQQLERIKPESSAEDKIMALFDVVFGFRSQNRYNSDLQILSQRRPLYDMDSQYYKSDDHRCTAKTDTAELPGVKFIVVLEHGILGLKNPSDIIYLSGHHNQTFASHYQGEKLYTLKYDSGVTNFKLVKLCHGQGIYIEGIHNGKLLGNIFKIKQHGYKYQLSLYKKLAINKMMKTISGLCYKNEVTWYITTPVFGPDTCAVHIGNKIKHFRCDLQLQVEMTNHSIISVNSVNQIQRTIIESKHLKTETIKQIEKSSQIYMTRSQDGALYVLIVGKNDTELCMLEEEDDDKTIILCNKTILKTSPNNIIRFGLVSNQPAVFINSYDKQIDIIVLSKTYIMSINTSHVYDTFETFSMNGQNIIQTSSSSSINLIKYQNCKP